MEKVILEYEPVAVDDVGWLLLHDEVNIQDVQGTFILFLLLLLHSLWDLDRHWQRTLLKLLQVGHALLLLINVDIWIDFGFKQFGTWLWIYDEFVAARRGLCLFEVECLLHWVVDDGLVAARPHETGKYEVLPLCL